MVDREIYRIIGRRLRARRLRLGMTLSEVAAIANLTFQQIQKHESAQTALTVPRIFVLATALQMPVGELLADLDVFAATAALERIRLPKAAGRPA